MSAGDERTICLVEDDPIMGESLVDRLTLEGIACDWYRDGCSALEALRSRRYGAVVSDIRLPDLSGAAVFRTLLEEQVAVSPTLFVTGFGTIPEAVELLRLGARDYITKPFDIDALIERLRALAPAVFTTSQIHDELPVMGVSAAMRSVQQALATLAAHPAPVLLTGESGVGKEFAARYLHDAGPAGAARPFQAINCGAVPSDLLEAELFGYRRGAFTGATRDHRGVFERAHGGTLLLDEVGEMPPAMQVTLLRVLESGRLTRIGEERDVEVDVRVVCATHRDLRALVEQGTFREDLFFRINVANVHLLPLRERPQDVSWFAQRFLREFGETQRRRFRLTPPADQHLCARPWPGNVRELRHAIQRATIFATSDVIDVDALMETAGVPVPDGEPAPPDLRSYLERCERQYVEDALVEKDWAITATAAALGISRKSLWEKMRKHGICREDS